MKKIALLGSTGSIGQSTLSPVSYTHLLTTNNLFAVTCSLFAAFQLPSFQRASVRESTSSHGYQRSNRAHELNDAERSVYDTLDPLRIPQHVAIIMDGNGRWAGKRALKRFLGHQQGAESVQYVVETASRVDLPWLTLYAFSLERCV